MKKTVKSFVLATLFMLAASFQQTQAQDLSCIRQGQVIGAILAKYKQLGACKSFLKAPKTKELKTPDGVGRFNHFEGGSIYWTPQTGAHEVHGAIRSKWESMGWERSFLGYPTTDEVKKVDGTCYSKFQGGRFSGKMAEGSGW
ncbi:MAG: hypothetical protein R3B47_05465 [Bacteroidia bacterium]